MKLLALCGAAVLLSSWSPRPPTFCRALESAVYRYTDDPNSQEWRTRGPENKRRWMV